MIESGTHTPGISAADFGLPPHTALRYERPAPALRDHLTSYAVLDSEAIDPNGTSEWMLPGWAQIWIVITDGPISVAIGNRRYDPLPTAILYGVTSRAMPVTAHGGVSIAIDVSPLGWARLFSDRADLLRDRVTPLEQVLPTAWVEELVTLIRDSDRSLQVKDLLDGFFLKHMAVPHPDEPQIAQVMALIVDHNTRDLATAAAAIGIGLSTLRRLSNRYFGFPPKTLMMRARFLGSLLSMMKRPDRSDYALLSPAYHDASHFIRDGKRFLGMTPRRFIALDKPYLDAALRARRLVLGASTPSLDGVSPDA
ncbi:helix-turn-helix domain-containing protein [Sphingomonas sp. GB1N7]|uniref:helix-turn-helix domain-containing protein n=1 Tax=Parasphingomonas caseinilytica TaxID=3096158 RepID=UPI002FCC8D73